MHPCRLPGNQRKLFDFNSGQESGSKPRSLPRRAKVTHRFGVSNKFTLEVVHINMRFLHIEDGCRADEYRNRRSIGERGHA
jgi:hypothetical protein